MLMNAGTILTWVVMIMIVKGVKMIICDNYEEAKLEAVKKLVEEDVSSVIVYYDKNLLSWCVDWEILSNEEIENI